MKDNVDTLIEKVDELIRLMEKHNEKYWSEYFRKAIGMVKDRNFRGIELILKSFGGMGSFNDLVITRINGHTIQERDEEMVNEKMKELKENIYKLSIEIKHEYYK
jgi:hypothetical protein